ncbi:hypothetical protein [Paludisphaera mucosa]|uniref:Peptidase MA-like domain-containing protein n=1 Tax=Paludisphaera mucosa TaxID=3030827 RepID=A0ABT6F438_9BACT|nr:hypothetical protein [Paludisphaera mucosa]MDG3002203.1 hypothetical protein [Paludisphaera mucosa]
MRQALRTLLFVATIAPAALAAGGPADAVAQARKLIAAKDLKAASGVLEEAIGAAPAPAGDDRKALVDLLKETYKGLIRDAKAAGTPQVAASYEDDLAILEAAAPAPAPAATPAPAPAPPVVPPPTRSLPPVPESTPPPAEKVVIPHVEAAPAPAPAPAGVTRPADLPPPGDPAAASAPTLEPEPEQGPVDVPAKVAPPPRSHDEGVGRAAAVAPQAPDELAQADALFNKKQYDQAGKIYAGLARKGQLPAVRNKVWAYCRWSTVVARINAGPKTKPEWDVIEREIESIQRLTPGNWFGEYLKDLVADARSGKRPIAKSPGLAVRGASPDEPEPAAAPQPRKKTQAQPLELPGATDTPVEAAPTAAPEPELAPAPADEPQASAPAVPRAAAPVAWQVHETASFRIFHTDPALAAKAAESAESVRASQGKRWASPAARGAWSPRCDIYLYPTAADFARMTGQPETSPGFSTMGIGGGQVVARRVNLRADHPQLIAAVLPHEVTHVVLADVFTDQQIPRWADEGMAVLAEPVAEQVGRAVELNAPLAEDRVFRLDKLMTIDYPESKDWNLYYAQSVSLTQFLMAQGTPAQFVAFIKETQQRGPDAALRGSYRIAGLDDLDRRWRDYARAESARLASAATDGATTK